MNSEHKPDFHAEEGCPCCGYPDCGHHHWLVNDYGEKVPNPNQPLKILSRTSTERRAVATSVRGGVLSQM